MPAFANLFGSILFGSIGLGGVSFGRKSGLFNPIFFGIALMVFPYFVAETWLMYVIGIGLTAAMVHYRHF